MARPLLSLALLLLPVVAPGPAEATIFVRPSDAELVDQSPVVVQGRVLSVMVPVGPALEYRFAVDHVLRGSDRSTLRVRVPGGPDQGAWWHVVGAPRFSPGDELLLFLTPRVDGSFDLNQFMLGAFRIVPSPDGPMAIRDLAGAHELFLPGRPRVDDGPRHLELFRQWLLDRIRGVERAMDYFATPTTTPGQPVEDGPPPPLVHRSGGEGNLGGDFQTIFSTDDPSPVGCGVNGGHGIRWFDFDTGAHLPWRAYFSGQPGLPGSGLDELVQALEAWSHTGRPVSLFLDGLTNATDGLTTIDNINTVLFDDPEDAIGGSWQGSGTLAIGGPWFRCDLVEHQGVEFHPIVEGDIVTQDGLSAFFANNPAASAAAAELFAHELGHTLGLAHSLDPHALMYSELHNDGRGATLTDDELAALDFLYSSQPVALPAAPSDLEVTVETARSLRLAWTDQSDNENGFQIQRQESGGFVLIGNAARNSETWVDIGVMPGTTYRYRLRAENGAGTSEYSDIVEVTTPEEQPPLPPTHLRVAPLSSTQLRLTWQDNAVAELGYRVEILADGGGDEFIEIPIPLDANSRVVLLSGLEPDSNYSVRVRAFNSAGRSEPSNLVTVHTFPANNACEVTDETLCLLGGRFEVRLEFRNQHDDGEVGPGFSLPDSDATGFFWFFNPGNLEVVVKMIDGRAFNGHYWVYLGGITDLEYRLTITDTLTGAQRVHDNRPGMLCGFAEIQAFDAESSGFDSPWTRANALVEAERRLPSRESLASILVEPLASDSTEPPQPALAAEAIPGPLTEAPVGASTPKNTPCVPGPSRLCLLDNRLQLDVSWSNPYVDDVSGIGEVIELSSTSGMFWFFDPRSIEMIVKAVDGSNVNGHLWLFYGALTDVEYWITATDTLTGNTRTYYNPPGNLCGRADIEALVSDPGTGPPIQP